ncbi:non-structural maintenance of chromosomes element 4 homolog A isoform X3 [Petaurus breviceps papuanus]
MLSSKSNKLTDALEQANQLFNRVSQAREAALDAQFLVLASDLGKERANQLHSDMTLFDPGSYSEDLLKYMGLNRLEVQESDGEEEPLNTGFLPEDSWLRVGIISVKYLKFAPTFHFLFGSFKTDPPVPKQRQKKKDKKEEERAMPAELKKMEESQQEATEKEVERILGLLQTYFREEPETPISFFDFVIDPDSFARTVENIFHVSFIVRDGFARIRLDQDKLPIIGVSNENWHLKWKEAYVIYCILKYVFQSIRCLESDVFCLYVLFLKLLCFPMIKEIHCHICYIIVFLLILPNLYFVII